MHWLLIYKMLRIVLVVYEEIIFRAIWELLSFSVLNNVLQQMP